jgi:hypothetical protein
MMVNVALVTPPSVLPDISPRGERGWANPLARISVCRFASRLSGESLSPLEGEMPGTAEGGNPESQVPTP